MRFLQVVPKLIGRASIWLVSLVVLSGTVFVMQSRVNQEFGLGSWVDEHNLPERAARLAVSAGRKLDRTTASAVHVIGAGFTNGKSRHMQLATGSQKCSAARQILIAFSSSTGSGNSCSAHAVSRTLAAALPAAKETDDMAPVSFQAQQKTDTTSIDSTNDSSATNVPEAPVILPLAALSSSADCSKGTLMTVIAHEDDDLLFMNPDLMNAANAGECLRTVYVTAGDAGENQLYWSSRESGAKAAYAKLYNQPDDWTDTQETLNGKTVETSTLKNVPQLSLVFLRLPDGNIGGQGFAATHQQSLKDLLKNTLPSMQTVDGSNTYTKDDLIAGLLAIMNTDEPTQIHTQGLAATADGDHADHVAVGEFTMLAAQRYEPYNTITQYAGYPERTFTPNLKVSDIAVKQQIFFAYAAYDSAVCDNVEECATAAYSNYLTRQFKAEVPLTSSVAANGQ